MASTTSPPEPQYDGTDAATRSLVFRVAGRVYVCDVTAVREVAPIVHITRLPGAPESVLGLVNIRGSIITVVDAGMLMHGAGGTNADMLLLVDVGPRGVGLAVERVADVRALRPDEGYKELDVRDVVARVVEILEEG